MSSLLQKKTHMNKTINELRIELVDSAIEKAEANITKLDKACFNIPGMSGVKTRIFLNELVGAVGGRYLEIGIWAGSTFCSALHKSTTNNYSVACDNWSEFGGGAKPDFLNNLNNFVDLENLKVSFVEKDYRDLTKEDLMIERFGKFPIYLYDGPHDFKDQYDAIMMFLQYLEDDFVFLCDDWNWTEDVEGGTRKAIEDSGLVIHKEWVMTTPNNIDNDRLGWWNGYYAFVASQKK